MEKLKYFSFALLVALCAGFVSCSDDDDEEKGGLVGVWQGESVDYEYLNGELQDSDSEEIRIDLKADGSYIFYSNGEYGWGEGERGTWSQSDGKFIVYEDGDEDDPTVFNIIEMTGSKLVVGYEYKADYSYSGYTYVYEVKNVMTLYKQ